MRGGVLVAAVAAVVLLGCSSGDSTGEAATLPTAASASAPTTTADATTTTVTPSTSVAAATSTVAASTTVATSLPPGVVGLSPDGPWHMVDSAPGVTAPGLVYELMPKLWAFIQVAETDASTYSWTLNESDRPIIEAYLQAQLTYYQAVTSNPIDLDLPGWNRFYADGGSAQFANLEPRRAAGEVVDMDLGVVYLPQVLSDERSATTALIADCFLDGGVFLLPDGALAPGSTPGVAVRPWATRMELIDGRWVVGEEGAIAGGCV